MPIIHSIDDLPEGVCDAGMRWLYRYWDDKRGDRRAPARADIDPLDMPGLLPNIWMMDVTGAPGSDDVPAAPGEMTEADKPGFRMRLMGTGLVEAFGCDLTGAPFEAMFKGPEAAEIYADFCAVLRTWRPHYAVRSGEWAERGFITYSRLALPLSGDGARIDRLLGLTCPAENGRAG